MDGAQGDAAAEKESGGRRATARKVCGWRRCDGYHFIMAVSILLAGTVLLLADLGALVALALEFLLAVDLVMDFLDRTAMVVLLGLNL